VKPIEELTLTPEWQRAFGEVETMIGGRVVAAEQHERWRPAYYLEVERDGEILPVYFRGDRGDLDHGVYPLEHEMGVMQILEAEGLLVPHIYGFCEEPRGIVMERRPGRPDLSTARNDAEARAVLEHYMEILAQLHAIPLDRFASLQLRAPQNAHEIGLGDFPKWEKSFRLQKNQPEPLIEFVTGWLKRNVPEHRTQACMVAGDSGQFIFENSKVTAVLDLELAYIGDPMADFAGMLCRDLSEPFGDLSHGFRHYAEITGEAIDVEAVKYHTIRFGLVTPMTVAPLCAQPPPGLNVAQYVGWNLVYGRIPLELLAGFVGGELQAPELPTSAASRFGVLHDSLVRDLEASNDRYEIDVSLRTAQYLREIDRNGGRLEEQDLEEVGELLGKRPSDWQDADAALEAFVLAAGPDKDAALVEFFYRRTLRHEALLRPAMRELEHSKLHEMRL
jgi:aminoglycoside phosphotransferase (APT) family kinase protein